MSELDKLTLEEQQELLLIVELQDQEKAAWLADHENFMTFRL